MEKHDFFADKASIPSFLDWGEPKSCSNPRISVIMPVYKRPEYFERALQSVLKQDCSESFEVIVVDNNDEEVSPNRAIVEKVADSRVLYYRNAENLGMYQNWNRGIELARSPYITFCHDDDLLLPHTLRSLLSWSNKVGESCILSALHTINDKDVILNTSFQFQRFGFFKPRVLVPYTKLGQYLGNVSCGDGCLYHRQELLELGGYDPSLYPVADYALNVAYARRYGAWILTQPMACYRVADNESLRVYESFPDAIKGVHLDMKKQGKAIDYLTGPLIQALYHSNQRFYRCFWGGNSSAYYIKWRERLLIKIAGIINRFNFFSF